MVELENELSALHAQKEKDTHRHRICTDTLIRCNIAFLHDALKGDGDPNTPAGLVETRRNLHLSLHETIRQAEDRYSSSGESDDAAKKMAHAQILERERERILEVAWFIAERFFCAHERKEEAAAEEKQLKQKKEAVTEEPLQKEQLEERARLIYREEMESYATQISALLSSKNFVSLNVHAPMSVQADMMRALVKLDRLPIQNSLEGLLLLQECWCEYDVAMHLADKYKRLSKVLFVTQLLIGWAIVFVGTAQREFGAATWQHVVFGLSIVITLVFSFDALLNCKARWRQLRSAAGFMESIIYMYRARVGPFEVTSVQTDSRTPEIELYSSLVKWRSDLVQSGDLQLSALMKQYPTSIFKHGQAKGNKTGAKTDGGEVVVLTKIRAGHEGYDSCDNFHSPILPDMYVKLRLNTWLAFYEQRIPHYARFRSTLRVILILLAAAASVVSAYGYSQWALVITSAAAMVTSWVEFADHGKKTERYTRAVVEIKNLKSRWTCFMEEEKAAPANIAYLVQAGESIISNERVAWMSTSNSSRDGDMEENAAAASTTSYSREAASTNKVHPA